MDNEFGEIFWSIISIGSHYVGQSSLYQWGHLSLVTPPLGIFKLNSNATFLDGKASIGAIVCDARGDVLLAMESHFDLIGSAELVETIVMYHGIFRSFETDISLL